jgi:hypothetical protein
MDPGIGYGYRRFAKGSLKWAGDANFAEISKLIEIVASERLKEWRKIEGSRRRRSYQRDAD